MTISATPAGGGGERFITDTGKLGAAVATIVQEHLTAFGITDALAQATGSQLGETEAR